MATSVARKAVAPGASLLKAWSLSSVPKLCAPLPAESFAAPVVPLPCEQQHASQADHQQVQAHRQKPIKSFHMHIGGALHIPTKNAQDLPKLAQQPAPQQNAAAALDPFEGLPFRGIAERMGEVMLPSLEAAREAERKAKLVARRANEEAEVAVPQVPHLLPFTRWAASSTSFRSTFIADPPKERKKARLSWYHPDDTMVPRDWWSQGLLADIKYYMPFGLGADKNASA